jgi:putative glycosyltransferase
MPPGTPSDSEIELSIVTTLYYSAPYLEEFYKRIRAEVQKITPNYEIILVNDGSPDDVLEVALGLYNKDQRIRILDLSRNFGHHRAMMTGLRNSTGVHVFLIDVDLEEPPELLSTFWNRITEDATIDVVYGEMKVKEQGLFRNCLSKCFYFLFNMLSTYKMASGYLVARLMNRNYVNALITYTERELFLPGIWAHAGFNQVSVTARKAFKGRSTYTLKKRILMAVDAIASFSSTPLLFVFYAGATISAVSVSFMLYLVIRKLFYADIIAGWTSVMVSIYLMGGFIMCALGIIGIYLSKIYSEIKGRPYSIIKNLYQYRTSNESTVSHRSEKRPERVTLQKTAISFDRTIE